MENDPAIIWLVESLRRARNVVTQWQLVDLWAQDGDADRLTLLAVALHDAGGTDGNVSWAVQSMFDRILDTLALRPAPGFAAAALRLACLPHTPGAQPSRSETHRERRAAQYLAACQPTNALVSLFQSFGAKPLYYEALACLLHEMILRGFDAESRPETARFVEVLRNASHPLVWLPSRPHPLEGSISAYLPRFASCHGPQSEPPSRGPQITETVAIQLHGVPLADDVREETIRSVVAGWLDASNGKSEVTLIRLDPSASPDCVNSRSLRSLGLASIGSAGDDQIDVRADGPEGVLASLYAASANGGAYTTGRRGAYGRLDAWRSFGALAGIVGSSNVESIADQAGRCAWFSFLAESGWFEEVAWDIGIACLLPGGSELAVLAATDTD